MSWFPIFLFNLNMHVQFLNYLYHLLICFFSIHALGKQGHTVDLVQREVRLLLQSALSMALLVIRSNPAVLEGIGAQLEGSMMFSKCISFFENIFLLEDTLTSIHHYF